MARPKTGVIETRIACREMDATKIAHAGDETMLYFWSHLT